MQETDTDLMSRIKHGDMRAFEALLERHQKSVYNIALRFLGDVDEAQDVAQETFLRVYRAAGTYTPQAKFSTWLYTIVKNLSFNVIRKNTRADIVAIDDEKLPEIPSRNDTPYEQLSRKQVAERVNNAVGSLPPSLRMAVILQKYYGLSYEEISKVLGGSVNAIKLRVHRAKEILVKDLNDVQDETK